jgi:hypothetical protein
MTNTSGSPSIRKIKVRHGGLPASDETGNLGKSNILARLGGATQVDVLTLVNFTALSPAAAP